MRISQNMDKTNLTLKTIENTLKNENLKMNVWKQ